MAGSLSNCRDIARARRSAGPGSAWNNRCDKRTTARSRRVAGNRSGLLPTSIGALYQQTEVPIGGYSPVIPALVAGISRGTVLEWIPVTATVTSRGMTNRDAYGSEFIAADIHRCRSTAPLGARRLAP